MRKPRPEGRYLASARRGLFAEQALELARHLQHIVQAKLRLDARDHSVHLIIRQIDAQHALQGLGRILIEGLEQRLILGERLDGLGDDLLNIHTFYPFRAYAHAMIAVYAISIPFDKHLRDCLAALFVLQYALRTSLRIIFHASKETLMSLPVYFAPMEGVTDAVYRRVHHAHFSGIDKYFIPFISPTQNLVLTPRERSNVSPEVNAGLRAVPQILTKKADHFLWAAQILHDMGYEEINLNIGCPSGTVTSKGKGSGMLLDLHALDSFLEEVYAHTPVRVSIKTRIGFFSADEFGDLLEIYNRYPVHELIIHPRTREQQYKGTPHREVYQTCEEKTPLTLVYNGDLFTPQACCDFAAAHSSTHALMLGRGMLANPALAQTYAGGAPLTRQSLKAFHDDLFAAYQQAYHTSAVLGRMREVAKNIACCFDGADKPLKAARKANSIPVYEDAMARLFGDYTLSANPCFSERS